MRETYAASVTVSPRGNVWVKHGQATEVSILDGYDLQTLASPGKEHYRVYESRTGQLWSLCSSGLVVYASGQWVRHLVPEIRAEIQSDRLRHEVLQVRQIPLLPADRDHVLFLLPDKLMDYDAAARRSVVIKAASETGLGKFVEMTEARDGGLLISGTRGLLKLLGPVRHLRSGASSQEFLLDNGLHVENVQKPFEDARGGVVAAAVDSRSGSKKVLVRWDGQTWTVRPVEAAVRQAWPAWDQTVWGYASSYLFRFDPPPAGTVSREKILGGALQRRGDG